jgi:hypothetical protein
MNARPGAAWLFANSRFYLLGCDLFNPYKFASTGTGVFAGERTFPAPAIIGARLDQITRKSYALA